MDRDQRSRRQKSGGGSFSRPPKKRSMASRVGLQKNTPRPANEPTPDPTRRQAAPQNPPRPEKQPRRAAPRKANPPRRAPQVNPQKADYRQGMPPRQRRVTRAEISRRRNRRRALGVLGVLAVLVLGAIVSVNLLFKVTAFRIEAFDGTTPADTGIYTEDQLLATLGIERGSNLFGFSTAAKTAELQAAYPYLDRIEVSTQLPGTVVIKVEPAYERFACPYTGGWAVLSDSLKILRLETEQPQGVAELRVTLPTDFTPAVGLTVTPQTYNSLLDTEQTATAESAAVQQTATEILDELLADVNEYGLYAGVTALDIADLSDMSFTYEGRVSVLLGNSTELAYKIRLAAEVLLDTEKGLSASDRGTLDVSYSNSDGDINAYFRPETAASGNETEENTEDTENTEAAENTDAAA